MRVTINKIIEYEKNLLEIENRYKFKLPFEKVYILSNLLEKFSNITSLFFKVQMDYACYVSDEEKLQKYHDKLQNDTIDIDLKEYKLFIEYIDSKFFEKSN